MESHEPTESDDKLLVQRTQSGDSSAFDALFIKYSQRIYGLVYHMTANHEDSGDLVQEVFAKAYRSIRGFQGKSSFYTWLHTIAVNMTINFLKKRGKRPQMSLDDLDSGLQNDKELAALIEKRDPLKEANLNDLKKRLNEAMQRLSHAHRVVVTMFDIQGMPHAEIAKILGISDGTVRSRLYYAHQELQAYLSDLLQ